MCLLLFILGMSLTAQGAMSCSTAAIVLSGLPVGALRFNALQIPTSSEVNDDIKILKIHKNLRTAWQPGAAKDVPVKIHVNTNAGDVPAAAVPAGIKVHTAVMNASEDTPSSELEAAKTEEDMIKLASSNKAAKSSGFIEKTMQIEQDMASLASFSETGKLKPLAKANLASSTERARFTFTISARGKGDPPGIYRLSDRSTGDSTFEEAEAYWANGTNAPTGAYWSNMTSRGVLNWGKWEEVDSEAEMQWSRNRQFGLVVVFGWLADLELQQTTHDLQQATQRWPKGITTVGWLEPRLDDMKGMWDAIKKADNGSGGLMHVSIVK